MQQAKSSHASFTDTANVVFAKAIGAEWVAYSLANGNTRQQMPDPEILPVAEGVQTQFETVTISEAVDTIPARWPLETDTALWTPQEPAGRHNSRVVRFIFYDAEQLVSIPKEYGSFHPRGISEADVSAFWTELSQYDYKFILADCAKYTQLHGYNDWAVLEWVQVLSAELFPKNIYSEQAIFTVFLLNQIGLMTKIARIGDQLVSMFAAMQPVYARKFIIIDTYPFYLAGKDFSASEVFTYSAPFMKPARPLDLRIQVAPAFGNVHSFSTRHQQSALFGMAFDLPVNQALIRFYGSYPQTQVSVYATAVPEARFATALTSAIGENIKGMSAEDALNRLLAFVQTDFNYMTDLSQFGYEKPFFCEENFVYGGNDCEDRTALFAFLVHSLLGNKVLLLEYPEHLCAAVQLPGDHKGDHVLMGGEKFYVCDPSYIGATLGMSIPKYKNQSVKAYVL